MMPGIVKVSIVVPQEVEPSVVVGLYDAFWAAGVLWNRIMQEPEQPYFLPELVGVNRDPVKTSTGINILPHRTLEDGPAAHIVLVPTLFIKSGRDFGLANPLLIEWVKNAHQSGSQVFSTCTGSFLLAEAGLLNNRDATTHWAFAEQMRAEYPLVRLHSDRVLVAATENGSIVTCGGAASWMDMVLYLVGRFATPEVAMHLAKVQMYDWHHQGQTPYSRLTTKSQTADRMIQNCQEWLADHYCNSDPVNEMIRQSGLSRRTFARRFRAATGHAPLDYVQRVRIEESKQILETERSTVEKIAHQVGYDDTVSFRRLFKRMVGETPAEYRKRQTVSDVAREITGLSLPLQ
jgi:transcriptional regulator GlxA family with amidase domain